MTREEYEHINQPDKHDICECWTGVGIFSGDHCMKCGCDEYESVSKAVGLGYITWDRAMQKVEE